LSKGKVSTAYASNLTRIIARGLILSRGRA
jgi:hypothetical protein